MFLSLLLLYLWLLFGSEIHLLSLILLTYSRSLWAAIPAAENAATAATLCFGSLLLLLLSWFCLTRLSGHCDWLCLRLLLVHPESRLLSRLWAVLLWLRFVWVTRWMLLLHLAAEPLVHILVASSLVSIRLSRGWVLSWVRHTKEQRRGRILLLLRRRRHQVHIWLSRWVASISQQLIFHVLKLKHRLVVTCLVSTHSLRSSASIAKWGVGTIKANKTTKLLV